MSTKDMRYYRKCPICSDVLPGTDDGLEVYEALKGQVDDNDAGAPNNGGRPYVPNCTLCGEDCESLQAARNIVLLGEPELKEV